LLEVGLKHRRTVRIRQLRSWRCDHTSIWSPQAVVGKLGADDAGAGELEGGEGDCLGFLGLHVHFRDAVTSVEWAEADYLPQFEVVFAVSPD
jgi:hypothetical protein